METLDALAARRNVRSYQDRAIPAADLDRILEAGRRAPSARNMQWWDFVVCTQRPVLQELARTWQGAGHIARSAATIAVVAPAPGDDPVLNGMIQYDLGQATANIMLAATDLGIGSAHAAARDQALARAILGLPEDRILAWLIALGYPDDRPLRPLRRPNRRPFDEVVHRERW